MTSLRIIIILQLIAPNFIFGAPNIFLKLYESSGTEDENVFSTWFLPASRTNDENPENSHTNNNKNPEESVAVGIPDWSIPPSRTDDDDVGEAGEIGAIDITWLGNATEEVRLKLESIRKKFSEDISTAVNGVEQQSTNTNATSPQSPPGYFASISFVGSFLQRVSELLFERDKTEDGEERNDDIRDKRDIPISGFGQLGEMINDSFSAVLNAIIVYQHKTNFGPECVQRLICESNREAFAKGYFVPAALAYAFNLGIASVSEQKASDVLIAARKGRKGQVDCYDMYKRCNVKL